jgi:GNAT superfamily N-acetyltransferase
VIVRPAEPTDLDALVDLRLGNARAHVALDPTVYRVPDEAAVREALAGRLSGGSSETRMWVAAHGEKALGMAEIIVLSEASADQILRPVAAAEVHVVVNPDARRTGVGDALLVACEQWAGSRGIERLVAGIQAENEAGLGLYSAAGYRRTGVVAIKDLAPTN